MLIAGPQNFDRALILTSGSPVKIAVLLAAPCLTCRGDQEFPTQNAKLSEKRKEAKDNLSVAKDKEKKLKQKMQDDIAKAIIAKEGVPLTIKEHDAIVSKIKDKAAEVDAEMLACKDMVPIDVERPDAMRTEPVFSDNNGHVYWRLKGCSEKPGVLQDIGTGDHTVEAVDKWFEYDDEQMDLIEKHINLLRSWYRKYKN
ncbi:hypothetical protein L1987_51444 [Smallanthus sonchifolius]|uniref:Uncharacterized protein n=1 Tax=Smallanthus sonchifolius TaxID=185202 RepID=A0ACB9ER03_9ASTR|nr:hypothetical protein L1987_51444 [Smallanthus sonchifolius]